MNNRLIILRGPSGAGKSTVANELFAQAIHKTAIIQQDYYRFIFKPAGGGSMQNSDAIHKMIVCNCVVALKHGYDVILEGILSVRSYGEVLDRIIDAHNGSSYMFYFDVSFEETAKRHQTRKQLSDFDVHDMQKWYEAAHRSNHRLERLIPEDFSMLRTVKHIQDITGN
ncbi:MAG: AAA family ATPase [Pseudomonadota bacterium]